MNNKNLEKKIKGFQGFTAASAPMHLGLCFPWMRGFMKMRKYYPECFSEVILISHQGIGYQWNSKTQNYLNVKQLYDKPSRTKSLMKEWRKTNNTFFHKWEKVTKNIHNFTNNALCQKYKQCLNELSDLWAPSLATDLMGEYTEGILYPEFARTIPEKYKPQTEDFFTLFCKPSYLSFITIEHISLLKLALKYKKKDPSFKKDLAKHQRSYFWIENNYKDIKNLDVAYFGKKAQAESRKSTKTIQKELGRLTKQIRHEKKLKNKLYKKLYLPHHLQTALSFSGVLGSWLDQRKETNLRSNHYLNLFYKEFSQRLGYSLENSYYLLPFEPQEIFSRKLKLPESILQIRKNNVFYLIEQPQKEHIVFGKEAVKLASILKNKNKYKPSMTGLHGLVVSKGKKSTYQGKIQIILDPGNSKFQSGNILVASQTRPEYVPLMRKSLCIITDEGGITSHAAIVSRELGIPCIIGTKVATRLFKDGDIVEVNMNRGAIQKIWKNIK